MVYLVHNLHRVCLSVDMLQITTNPVDQMIFECAFDNLMKEIRRKELVDTSTREVIGERLSYLINLSLKDT